MNSSHSLADDQKRTMNILADLSSSDEADQRRKTVLISDIRTICCLQRFNNHTISPLQFSRILKTLSPQITQLSTPLGPSSANSSPVSGTTTSSSTALASSTNDKTIIDFASLDISALEKYQHAFRVKTKRIRPTMPELTRAITDHYRQANLVDGEETEQELLTRFVWRVRGDSRYTLVFFLIILEIIHHAYNHCWSQHQL